MATGILKLGIKFLKPATKAISTFLKGKGAVSVSKSKAPKNIISVETVEDIKALGAIATGGAAAVAIPEDKIVSPAQRKQRQSSDFDFLGSKKRRKKKMKNPILGIPGKAKGGMFKVTKKGPCK